MGYLVNPASYVSVATFQALPNDYDLSGYTTAQLESILVAASGAANSIMHRDLLANEQTVRILGDGTNKLEIRKPLLYIKRVQIAIPGSTGMYIPLDQILVDYTSGSILEYTPMLWNGLGYFARFPSGIPVDVTLGSGFGYNPYSAPTYTTADANGNLAPGSYNLAVTTQTMNGETTAVVKQVSTAQGAIVATITETLGAYLYRAYISSAANNTTLGSAVSAGATTFPVTSGGTIAVGDTLLIGSGSTAEYATVAGISGTTVTSSVALVNNHSSGEAVIEAPMLANVSNFTAYGTISLSITISQLTPTQGLWADLLPLTDTSAPVTPAAITEAVRLLAMMQIYENNNLANRGVYMEDSGRKRVSWKSTEGMSGRGVPLYASRAEELLKPYRLQAIF